MSPATLDEEGKALLRKILLGQAYRQIMAANIRGHGLKFLQTTEGRRSLIADLDHILGQISRVQAIYSEVGGDDLRIDASSKMERIPYPGSKLELAAFLATSDLAEEVAMEGYVSSICAPFAEIARDNLVHERTATKRGQQLFQAFAVGSGQHPHAQQMFNRWVVIALLALGRPGSKGDQRAVSLGLRNRSCAQATKIYLERLEPFMSACKLELPDLASAGVQLPA
jgi:hypothetical protein